MLHYRWHLPEDFLTADTRNIIVQLAAGIWRRELLCGISIGTLRLIKNIAFFDCIVTKRDKISTVLYSHSAFLGGTCLLKFLYDNWSPAYQHFIGFMQQLCVLDTGSCMSDAELYTKYERRVRILYEIELSGLWRLGQKLIVLI